jgi:hypothetical protein
MPFKTGRKPLISDDVDEESTEALVIKLYRCAMAALCFGDTSSWDYGRRLLAQSVPAEDVGPLFGQFYAFGRALLAAAGRPLACRPLGYAGPCAEETLALRMIEMSQRSNPVGTIAAAAMLVGVDDLGGVLDAAQSLARTLAVCGLFVRGPQGGR